MHYESIYSSIWVFLALAIVLMSLLLFFAIKIMTYLDNRESRTLNKKSANK